MRPAPALECFACRRVLGKRAGHFLTDGARVLCSRCIWRGDLHLALWPDCDCPDHLPVDHTEAQGTRAGTAAALGLWPHGRTTS